MRYLAAPVVGENVRGMCQVLERVTGMDEIVARGFERHILDAGVEQLGARKLRAGSGETMPVGLPSSPCIHPCGRP